MTKNTFATLGIFAVLLLSFGFASAAVELNNVSIALSPSSISNVVTGGQYTVIATIDNQNTTDFYVKFRTTGWDNWFTGKNISAGTNDTFTGTFTAASTATKEASVDIYNASNNSQFLFTLEGSVALTYTDTFCEREGFDEDGVLEISDFDVRNNGDGSDDEWQYLDQLEITVEIENTDNNDDVDDVEVTILILDDKIENGGNDVTNDFDFDKETIKSIGRLRDGDQEEVMFVVDELSSDVADGRYYMYIMAYEDGNEAEQCISEIDNNDFYFEFTVESVDYEDSIIAKGPEFESVIDTFCGQQNLEITVPVYNLGDDDEERVLVNLYDSALGIDEYQVLKNMDNGDKEILTFFVNVPEGLANEKYNLDVIVSFDWDDSMDEEDPLAYDEENTETIRLNILACATPAPSVAASLDSETKVGTDLVVKATITNTGDLNDFTIAATGFESWAKLVSITPSVIEIASGNSQEVTIVLSPKEAGVQTFEITTTVDGETYKQAVSVNVAERQYPFGMSQQQFYLTAAIALLAILILLVLIVRVARRPAKRANF